MNGTTPKGVVSLLFPFQFILARIALRLLILNKLKGIQGVVEVYEVKDTITNLIQLAVINTIIHSVTFTL
jgi:hypothetical protein